MAILTDVERNSIRSGLSVLASHGLIEINVSKSIISWTNAFIHQRCARESRTIVGTSLYGLVEESYRAKLSFILNSLDEPLAYRKTVWPVSSTHKIRWWSVELVSVHEDVIYAICIPTVVTELSGPTYEFASLMAGVVENNSLTSQLVGTSMKRTSEEVDHLKAEIEATRQDILAAIKSSEEAAKISVENKQAVETLRISVAEQMSSQTHEISSLVTSNAVHDKRMSIFEEHVKKTTTDAIKEISDQADASKQVLSKNVTVPVTLTGIIVAIVQYIVTHWKL